MTDAETNPEISALLHQLPSHDRAALTNATKGMPQADRETVTRLLAIEFALSRQSSRTPLQIRDFQKIATKYGYNAGHPVGEAAAKVVAHIRNNEIQR